MCLKTQSLIHYSSWSFTPAAGTCGTSQTVRGGAEGGQTRGGGSERGGAEASGGDTEGGGEEEERHQRETESERLCQTVEPRNGGATQQAASDR